MAKRTSIYPLLISYFIMYFNTYFINPYLALDSLIYTTPRYALLIAVLIFISPIFAQFTTLYGFSSLAEKKHREEWLIILGYSFGFLQWILLMVMTGLGLVNPYVTLVITMSCNLFMVAYIPAVKAYLTSRTKVEKKGKALGQLNMIESLAWFFGMILGGIIYNPERLHYMILVAVILSIFSILLIPLIGDVKIESADYDPKIAVPEPIIITKIIKSTYSFKELLAIQFGIFIFSSTFFGLIGAYQQSLGTQPWFYGLTNAIPGILSIIVFWIFGKILDRSGPDFLIFYGWISYALVYLGLLTGNIVVVFFVWIFPAYAFKVATEYMASQLEDKSKAIRNMALASFFALAGNVLGGIMGGLLTLLSEDTFVQFRIVIFVSLIGVTFIGIMFSIIFVIRKIKMKKSTPS
ncbi:MAG: MFS transporter [Promethearchaeota archaeon]|nr:MAG: MFS transporter [Candidatus Lokiarchaeota archaeon]